MRHERILVVLILSEIIMVVFSILSELVLQPFLPGPLRAFRADHGGAATRVPDTLLTVLWISVVVGTTVAWIGLLNLVRAARSLYLWSWAGYFVLILLSGPVVSTAVGYVIQMLTALVSGTIVGMVYLSELRTKFRTLAEAVREMWKSAA